jgi:hypothetical protein
MFILMSFHAALPMWRAAANGVIDPLQPANLAKSRHPFPLADSHAAATLDGANPLHTTLGDYSMLPVTGGRLGAFSEHAASGATTVTPFLDAPIGAVTS